MAQWKQTLEPYVKVIESVKQTSVNPRPGEDLIIGCVIISDAGPSTPTLIRTQREFLDTYAAEGISEKYTDSLNELYTGDNKTLASTMWLNAYRLAGSGYLLVSRATKAEGLIYSKPLEKNNNSDYILKDTEVLKAVPPFKLVIDMSLISPQEVGDISVVTSANDGWAISIKDTGVFGNRVNDNGPLYDFYVSNLYDLVHQLNETTKFYSPDFTFYKDAACTEEVEINDDNKDTEEYKAVKFNTVYLAGGKIMEPRVVDAAGNVEHWGYDSTGENTNNWGDEDSSTGNADVDSTAVGCAYILPENIEGTSILNLNTTTYSDFEAPKYYATNLYNSRQNLKVRIRRFNHNAVQSVVVSEGSTESPYRVLESVLDVYTKKGTQKPSDSVLGYDFYEFLITDSSISADPVVFNVGKVPGRGDVTIADVNNALGLMHLTLPLDLIDLGLDYYGYQADGENEEISVNLKIGDSDNTKPILNVSDADIMRAWTRIEEDERYIVEGFTDLGCTETAIQNYIANIAVNSNYFYAVSTALATNYMVIANKRQKITADSRKLWFGAPWDYDDGTVGYLFNCSPSVIYWETVFRNRRNNNEFAATFGQNHGVVSPINLAKEFKKSERQLLLTKKINTIYHDLYNEMWYWNDNVTAQSADDVMKEEGNSRMSIHISKVVERLLGQFKGHQHTPRTRAMVTDVIDFWMRNSMLPKYTTIQEWRTTCSEANNTEEDIRANRLNVKLEVRFTNSIKYIEVLQICYPMGLEFE